MGYDLTGPEVHADGEIRTPTLWGLHKALVAEHGPAKGPRPAPPGHRRDAADRARTFVPRRRDGILDRRPRPLPQQERRPHLVGVRGARRRGLRGLRPPATTPTRPRRSTTPLRSRNGTVALTLVNASTGQKIPNAKVILGRFEARVSPLGPHGLDGRVLGQGGRGQLPADHPGTRLRHPDDRGLQPSRQGRTRPEDGLARAQPRLDGGRREHRVGLEPGRRLTGEVRLRRHGRLGVVDQAGRARPTTPVPTSG